MYAWSHERVCEHDYHIDDREGLHREAIRFATAKGVRNGRTAQQFYRQFAGEQDLGRLK